MMKQTQKALALILAAMLLLMPAACASTPAPDASQPEGGQESSAFVPRLDTEQAVTLNLSVLFGNFEALDQVINHFNEYYPNVTLLYDQLNSSEPDFFENNPYIDIFMTTPEKGYPAEMCADLLAEGVDVSDVNEGYLQSSMTDGKLLTLPMGLKLRGLAVNRTLLESEGLTVPQTWDDFLDVLEALQQKGYTPLQGPANVTGLLILNMGMDLLNSDDALFSAVMNGDAEAAAALKEVYGRLATLLERGYLSPEVNAEYPEDNYDGAIMKFFEGDVPFWICDTEKVSGMKKRESKSEHFSAAPFEYEFIYAPLGENGVYAYLEPWYGFSLCKDSDDLDYAAEFLRFMAREEELNTLASVKGVPSITKNAPDERYVNLRSIEKVEMTEICDGTVPVYIGTLLGNAGNELVTGALPDVETAVRDFVRRCAAS